MAYRNLFHFCLSLLIKVVLSNPAASLPAGVTCSTFTPQGWTPGNYKVLFYDNNPLDSPSAGPGLHAPSLPAKASNHPIIVPSDLANSVFSLASVDTLFLGNSYIFEACTMPSLGLTSPTTQSSCSHGGCYISYTNYVRIRNPATLLSGILGQGSQQFCLSYATPTTAAASNLNFQPCAAVSTSQTQYFIATQQVTYAPGYASVTAYGDVDVQFIQTPNAQKFLAWSLARTDNRTLQVVKAGYTQVGLSAKLVVA